MTGSCVYMKKKYHFIPRKNGLEERFGLLDNRRLPVCNDGTGNETGYPIYKMAEIAKQCRDNRRMKNLLDMTEEEFSRIKHELEDRRMNSTVNRELDEIGSAMDLQKYLWNKFSLPHNMVFVQGLFLASKLDRLYQKCVEFAKSIKQESVTFFEQRTSMTDSTKVEYIFYCPVTSEYTYEDLENLLEILMAFTDAKYDDITVSEVKEGCIHVTLMIRNHLIPTLRTLYSPENRHKTCQRMSKSLQHRIMKVLIQGIAVYTHEEDLAETMKEVEERTRALEKTRQQVKNTTQHVVEYRSMNLLPREKLRQQQESEREEMPTQQYKQRVWKLEQNTDDEPHERRLLDENLRKENPFAETCNEMSEMTLALEKTRQQLRLLEEKLRGQQESVMEKLATLQYKQRVEKLEQNTDEEPHELRLLDENLRKEKTYAERRKNVEKVTRLVEKTHQRLMQRLEEHRSMNLSLREKLRPQQREYEKKGMIIERAQNIEEELNRRRLLDENRKLLYLSQRTTCKVCLNEEVQISFLPCAHLVTCGKCGVRMKICPVCRQKIQDTVRVILS